MTTRQVIYNASHRSDAFLRAVRSPVGSGKSTAMSWKIMRRGKGLSGGKAHGEGEPLKGSFPALRNRAPISAFYT